MSDDVFYVRVGHKRVAFQTPADPQYANLADFAECVLCGAIVDVGGEIHQHAAEHAE